MDAEQMKQLKPMLDKYLRHFDDCFGRIEPTERLKAYVIPIALRKCAFEVGGSADGLDFFGF
jgi:hypothetical protein